MGVGLTLLIYLVIIDVRFSAGAEFILSNLLNQKNMTNAIELKNMGLSELESKEAQQTEGGLIFLLLLGTAASMAAGATLVAIVGAGLYNGWTAYE